MKLPTAQELAQKIIDLPHVQKDLLPRSGTLYGYYIRPNEIEVVAEDILGIIKSAAYDTEETAEIDSNLQKIAELEAKIFVYESFIKSVGFKLPKEGKAKPE